MTRLILCFLSVAAFALALSISGFPPQPAQAQSQHLAQAQTSELEARKNVQRQLQALGLYKGAIDGIYGPGTVAAWQEFTRAAGIGPEFNQHSRQLLFDAAAVTRARNVGLATAIRSARTLPEARALRQQARKLYDDGQYDAAIPLYDRALTFFETALGSEHADLAGVLIDRGLAYYGRGEYDRAIVDYDQAIRLDLNDAIAYNNRGLAYNEKGEWDRAIADFDRAIRLNPELANAYNNRGNAYYGKGEYDRAIADYNETIRLDPKHVHAFNNRGWSYNEKGEWDRAIADLDQAIRLDPKYVFAYNNRGNAYRAKREYDRAIVDYDQAIRLDPTYTAAFTNRGLAHRAKGDWDRAAADFEAALFLPPQYDNGEWAHRTARERLAALKDERKQEQRRQAEPHYRVGLELQARQAFEQAIASYDKAIKLAPAFAEAYLARAGANGMLGLTDAALADWKEAFSIDPTVLPKHSGVLTTPRVLALLREAIANVNLDAIVLVHAEPEQPGSFGRGFFISAEGHVVTMNHLLEGARGVKVALASGERVDAEIVGQDKRTDLALLRVRSDRSFPKLDLAPNPGRIGDFVLLPGSPAYLGAPVLPGILTHLNRHLNQGPYDEFLQISEFGVDRLGGGPVFNLDGRVIGLNTALMPSFWISFAIPASQIASVVGALQSEGSVKRGWLGVRVQDVSEEMAASSGMREPAGTLVADVIAGSPAALAGIESGDIILAFDGETVATTGYLPRIVVRAQIGKKAEVKLLRNGEPLTLNVVVGRLPEDEQAKPAAVESKPEVQPADLRSILGFSLSAMTDELRARFKIGSEVEGVVVTDVEQGTVAAQRAVEPGNVILEVSQEGVSSPEDVANRIAALKSEGRGSVLLLIAEADSNLRWVALRIAD